MTERISERTKARLIELKEKEQLSRSALSRRLGVSPRMVNHILRMHHKQ